VGAALAFAQRGSADLRGTVGYTTFLDESAQHHLHTGAAVRFYVLNKLSIEPEFLYLYKDSTDSDIGFQVNVARDFGKLGGKTVPYVVGGVGVLHTRLKFPLGNGLRNEFSTTEGLVSGGVGVKVYLNDRWFVAPEFRLGFETILRATVSIGYSWRR
jgi:hypothetical protein